MIECIVRSDFYNAHSDCSVMCNFLYFNVYIQTSHSWQSF